MLNQDSTLKTELVRSSRSSYILYVYELTLNGRVSSIPSIKPWSSLSPYELTELTELSWRLI